MLQECVGPLMAWSGSSMVDLPDPPTPPKTIIHDESDSYYPDRINRYVYRESEWGNGNWRWEYVGQFEYVAPVPQERKYFQSVPKSRWSR